MPKLNLYQKVAIATVAAVVFLIFVGGLVRVAGAGLGCPDWPKCWGCWVPPSDVSEIDATRYDVAMFNHTKMWIEYLNRIVGVTIGLLITATFALSFRYRRGQPVIFRGSFASFVLVLFQGWLGGQVVKSGLHAGMITLHMITAILLLSLLIYTTFRATAELTRPVLSTRAIRLVVATSIALYVVTVAQILMGSQVREAVEMVSRETPALPRGEWLSNTGTIFLVHRSFSWLVLAASALLIWWNFRLKLDGLVAKLIWLNGGFVIAQITFGVIMDDHAIPAFSQVLHLVISSVMVCAQFLLILLARSAKPDLP